MGKKKNSILRQSSGRVYEVPDDIKKLRKEFGISVKEERDDKRYSYSRVNTYSR